MNRMFKPKSLLQLLTINLFFIVSTEEGFQAETIYSQNCCFVSIKLKINHKKYEQWKKDLYQNNYWCYSYYLLFIRRYTTQLWNCWHLLRGVAQEKNQASSLYQCFPSAWGHWKGIQLCAPMIIKPHDTLYNYMTFMYYNN